MITTREKAINIVWMVLNYYELCLDGQCDTSMETPRCNLNKSTGLCKEYQLLEMEEIIGFVEQEIKT